jgi:phenylpropionate dioxygenase-like ring-hydroxylating dioxygenase large terminal subunit
VEPGRDRVVRRGVTWVAGWSGVLIEHEALRHQWHPVAESTDVETGDDAPARPIGVRLLGTDVVVWRGPDGAVVAAPDRCTHRESPLSLGTVRAGCLSCPYHGWTFGAAGACVLVPSSGAGTPVPPKAHLAVIHAREAYGLVWLCPGEPHGDIPLISHDADPTYRRINTGVETWSCSVTRMTDNFLDIAHFGWVHRDTIGRDALIEVPHIELAELDDGWYGYAYEVEVGNDENGTAASGQTGRTVRRRMTTGMHLPFTVRSTIHYETGLDHVILLCSTPVDDETSYFTFVVWRNDDFGVPAEEIIAFDRAIGAEDRRMLERIPGVLPLDRHATASVQADKPSIEWRRRLTVMLDPTARR